jgi:hypothetical protein
MTISSDYSLVPCLPRDVAGAKRRSGFAPRPEAEPFAPFPKPLRRSADSPADVSIRSARTYSMLIARQTAPPAIGSRVDLFI